MSFDDIPENKTQSYKCDNCEDGSIEEIDDGVFECDTCGIQHVTSNSKNNAAGYVY